MIAPVPVHCFSITYTPIYAFLTGDAGVGKSVVIRALYQSLYRILNLRDCENPDDIRILLCAYMGFAAFDIMGQTICSAFHKNVPRHESSIGLGVKYIQNKVQTSESCYY